MSNNSFLKMSHIDLRKKFFDFFIKKGHEKVESSSLIPGNDPTLLFTNAGMNQFKDLFLGQESRSYKKAVSVQKCVRAGGKHNDLDQVGFTDRHLTFFEMMGNFSFNDYFKKEAIVLAWEFLTQEVGISPEKLSVTIHDSDDQAYQIWKEEIGLSEEKITRMGDEDNFWQMGDTGPCGPCSEIFYDRGSDFENKKIFGGQATRYLEIWNLVFMQYENKVDGSREKLVKTGVDTGMGLERLVMALNDADHVFDTDIFKPLIAKIEVVSKLSYQNSSDEKKAWFHAVCDHARSAALILNDGGRPSNDGRGYVLRKIIRRALLFANKLSSDFKLFLDVVEEFIKQNHQIHADLNQNKDQIIFIVKEETEKFEQNLNRGNQYFLKILKKVKSEKQNKISGVDAFKLYDTYGFPLEVTRVLALENSLQVDENEFDIEMEKQKAQSGKNKSSTNINFEISDDLESEFLGYQTTQVESKIIYSQVKDKFLWIATEQTPFFVACGGQVSDVGIVKVDNLGLKVCDAISVSTGENKNLTLHKVELSENLNAENLVGKNALLIVDAQTRDKTAKNHTGTHLLQAALQKVLGTHAQQAGSLVDPEYLRFLFTHNKAMTQEEINQTEKIVNTWIMQNHPVGTLHTTLQEANKLGAMALFGEKYNPEKVRVITVGDFSAELCGGTHLKNSGQVGTFKIISEESVGSGVRSIIAYTGLRGFEYLQNNFNQVKNLATKFCVKSDQVDIAVEKLFEETKELKNQNEKLNQKLTLFKADELKNQFQDHQGNKILVSQVDNFDNENLRFLASTLVDQNDKSFVLLINKNQSKSNFIAMWSSVFSGKNFTNSVRSAFLKFGLKGGGKDCVIQGGVFKELNLLELKSEIIALF